jgi:hypothetical protein
MISEIDNLSTGLTTANVCAKDTGTAISHAPGPSMLFPVMAASGSLVQPVVDVVAYIANRKPQPHWQGEEHLLITLPLEIQKETKALIRACGYVAARVAEKIKVQPACERALVIFKDWQWKLKTFRAKYDLWADKQDWLVLVNKAKAPAAWRDDNRGLPEAFLKACETRFGKFGREDGKRQALLSIKRQWLTGKNEAGQAVPVPGYEAGWAKRTVHQVPEGWSYSNITRQIKARGKFTPAVRALLHDSESAARQVLPQVLGTRAGLRFMEKITFDDVRLDYLAWNPKTRRAEEVWALIARDEATAMVLGFVLHFSTLREDGTASHLGAKEMKELCAYLLERYPLPPYTVHWVVERGTATLAEAVKAALAELFNDRIKVHYTSMIGTKSPTGYKEKAKGNSRGKASHESHNRLFHTQGSWVEGQTGAHYGIRPAQLPAQIKECEQIAAMEDFLPEEKRGLMKYPLKLTTEIRGVFQQFCQDQNFRKEHNLEGFDTVLEYLDHATGEWKFADQANTSAGIEYRPRKEMPVERAMRLIKQVERWDRIDPAIILTFLEHTQRREEVNAKGEITFKVEGRVVTFSNSGNPLPPGTEVLAYHHPEEPRFLHLTDGKGCVLGTWVQRGRGAYQDQAALEAALRYTHSARQTAMDTATELAAPQIADLAAMREHNAALQQFVVTAEIPEATGNECGGEVARRITSAPRTIKQNLKAAADADDAIDAALRNAVQ